MRRSQVLARLRAGLPVHAFKLNLADARAAALVAQSGVDCIWLDLEHTPNDLAITEQCIWAAKSQDVDVMVRVARGSYSDYIRPLELDAAGIMVPHLMSAVEAREVVRMTRFHPLGRRPVDSGNDDGAYCGIDYLDYLRKANEERFLVVQIEDPEPLDELDAIAAIPGIDMLFFGPRDFAHGIGAPDQPGHPRLLEARRRVAVAARAHGKFAGTTTGGNDLSALRELGYQFLVYGVDVIGLAEYCRACVTTMTTTP
jgi:4-hydroxy-2-oxoheptanedioate aldolase